MGTTEDIKIWYDTETAYASGGGAAAYDMTHPAAVDELTRVNFLTGNFSLTQNTYTRERITPPGITLGQARVITTGMTYTELEFGYYLQTAADPFKALAIAGTRGQVGTTYYFQIERPLESDVDSTVRTNVFGAQLISYQVSGSIDSNKPPYVQTKWMAYADATNTGSEQTGAIPAGVINEYDDFTITVDGDAMTHLQSFDVKIENRYSDNKSGRNGSFNKYKEFIEDKVLTFSYVTFDDAAEVYADQSTLAPNYVTAAITDGTNTISVTNCFVIEGRKITETLENSIKMVEYTITLTNGASVFT